VEYKLKLYKNDKEKSLAGEHESCASVQLLAGDIFTNLLSLFEVFF
jgi:hypothetical protein